MPDTENTVVTDEDEGEVTETNLTVRSKLNRVVTELSDLAGGLSRVSSDLNDIRTQMLELTPIVSLAMSKKYLRVDSDDEDELITTMLVSSESLCRDVARLSTEQWEELGLVTLDENGIVLSTRSELYTQSEVIQIRELLKVAILYSVGYLYEHREDADHHELTLTLRNLLFSIREGSF